MTFDDVATIPTETRDKQYSGAIRIACLPSVLVTMRDVQMYVEYAMRPGDVSYVVIKKHVNKQTGAAYRSAIVGFTYIDPSIYENLQACGANGMSWCCPPDKAFVADNGMPLRFLKLYLTEHIQVPPTSTLTPLQLTPDDWTSIYIPNIPELFLADSSSQPQYAIRNEDDVVRIFEKELKIGKVSRVDFVPFDVMPEDRQVPHRSAYVHFEHWYDNAKTKAVRSRLETQGLYRYSEYYSEHGYAKAFLNDGYLVFKINRAPIPVADGTYNIHQLADMKFKLEKQNVELREELAKARAEIAELKSGGKVSV